MKNDILNKNTINHLMISVATNSEINKLTEYLNGVNNLYIKELCSGKIYIPPPKIFDEILKQKNINFNSKILERAKKESEKFYNKLFQASVVYQDDFIDFSEKFTDKIQPHGQKVINLLALVRLFKVNRELKESNSFVERSINKIRIHIKKRLIERQNLEYYVVNLIFFISLFLIASASFYLSGGLNSLLISSISSSIILIVGAILFIITRDEDNFELTDISGKNLIALKYRTICRIVSAQKNKKLILNHTPNSINSEISNNIDLEEQKIHTIA